MNASRITCSVTCRILNSSAVALLTAMPMARAALNLADASLLWLAADTGVTTIMTTDVREFSRYRLPDGCGFDIR